MCNSSDPYPRLEAETGLTRECLRVLSEQNCRIQIVTKSDLVVRDADLLSHVPSTVALTVTTDDDGLAKDHRAECSVAVQTPESYRATC